jgi:DNA invertase Pin-like site-specific DNA recombinase
MLSTGHSDRILAGLDRARRQGKRLGRPKKMIDLEKLATMLAAGHSVATIARAIATATYNKMTVASA